MSTKYPVTQAIRALRAADVAFEAHEYAYVEKGGTAASSAALGVPEHAVIKTLVLEDDAREPLVVLMHGDKQVSTRNLARQIGARSVQPCKPEVADRHSGYQVGGTSPFGTKRPMKHDPRAAPHLDQRRPSRLPRLARSEGSRARARTDPRRRRDRLLTRAHAAI
jgi:Cys-tRNA(Pro) deacylase